MSFRFVFNSWSYLFVALSAILVIGCKSDASNQKAQTSTNKNAMLDPEWIHKAMTDYSETIIDDVFSPPVASRNYAYPLIAAYEGIRLLKPEYASLGGQLNGLPLLPEPDHRVNYQYTLVALEAFYTTASKFIFSEAAWDLKRVAMEDAFKKTGISDMDFNNSITLGRNIAEAVKSWADKDNYKETRSMPKYTTTYIDGQWRPTPPDYVDALEPNWSKIRTMLMDSAAQFKPVPGNPFSKDKKSSFYDAASEVRAIGLALKPHQIEVANFWDDNPFVSNHSGHNVTDSKKLTPGGHWLNIVHQACEKTNSDILTSTEAYMLTSIAMFEGFISCWTEKYTNKLLRPETYINNYMDSNWRPYLQSPPFPEYPSGHSVISAASAEICTHVFGDNFAMTDSTENRFGKGVRSFTSFREAATEVSISRLYAGIHYRKACVEGQRLGQQIGKYVLSNIKTRSEVIGMK